MYPSVEDLVKAQSEAVKASNAIATTAFDGARKLAELNVQVTRNNLEQSAAHFRALLGARDPKALTDVFSTIVSQSRGEGSAAAEYFRQATEITSTTSAEISKVVESQVGVAQQQLQAAVEKFARSAPTGSEGLVNLMKQGVASANAAYEQVNGAVKQASQLVEANIAGATKAAAQAANGKGATAA